MVIKGYFIYITFVTDQLNSFYYIYSETKLI